MPNPCPSCNKMTSLELQDPEVSDEVFNGSNVTAQVRIVRNCEACGTEMKESTFDVDIPVEGFCAEEGHTWELTAEISQLEEGGGRYKKSYFGGEGVFKLKCSCGKTAEAKWSDKIAASDMDEVN